LSTARNIGGEDLGQVSSIRQVGIAAFMGAMIEWYDFFLYGLAAAVVFNQLFFPSEEPLTGTLTAFATFGVGFFFRPVGGVIFGHYGDKLGRKAILVLTLLIMGVATFLIGVLPTYQSAGLLAPILLVVLRICQGIGVGGEWGGAALMVVEHAPDDRRGFFGSWPQMGSSAGNLLAAGSFAAVSSLPEEQFLAWGWRLPFLLSAILIAVGLFIRLKISETPAFQQMKEAGTEARTPLVNALRTYPKSILLVIGMRVSENACGYIFSVFVLSYVTQQVGLSSSVAYAGVMIAAAVQFFISPVYGALSDRVGRRPVYMFGAGFLVLLAFPFFWLLDTGVAALIWLAIVLGFAVGNGAMFATQPAFFSELFGTNVRYTGVSLGYQMSAVFAGGLAPFIATALLAWVGSYWPVALYIMAVSLISFVSVYLATETFRGALTEELAREPGAEAGRAGQAT
jgi:MFS transporter, MHS family, shikimate and dehydroshikimate transport protein